MTGSISRSALRTDASPRPLVERRIALELFAMLPPPLATGNWSCPPYVAGTAVSLTDRGSSEEALCPKEHDTQEVSSLTSELLVIRSDLPKARHEWRKDGALRYAMIAEQTGRAFSDF